LLDNIIKDRDFAHLMQRNIKDLIIHFFNKNQHFGILCNLDNVEFNPPLPEYISSELKSMTLFFLAGYTFETAKIEGDSLIFEAGFGPDNIGSVVTVPLLSILQIIVEETPVLINLATHIEDKVSSIENIDDDGIKNSMASFLSNPENADFLKD